jgi:hypothetical protein
MGIQSAPPGASFSVESPYDYIETRSLPVSHSDRTACRKLQEEEGMAPPESFTKATGGFRIKGLIQAPDRVKNKLTH